MKITVEQVNGAIQSYLPQIQKVEIENVGILKIIAMEMQEQGFADEETIDRLVKGNIRLEYLVNQIIQLEDRIIEIENRVDKEIVISNGVSELTKEEYFEMVEKLKEVRLEEKGFIYLGSGEKFELILSDEYTLVVKLIV